MAHNLNIENEKVSMAYVAPTQNLIPWHGLGTRIFGESMTAKQALEASGLDFDANKQDVFILDGNGNPIKVEGKNAIVRSDNGKPLGIVGSRYEVLQNREAFSFFDAIVGEGKAIYETVGALGVGERIWILAKLPNDIVINNLGKQDVSKLYVLLANSHDGTSCVSARLTPVRVVCQNTLNAATAGGVKTVYIRHTKNIHDRITEAHKLMDIVARQTDAITELYNQFATIEATKDIQKVYMDRLFQIENEKDISTRTMNNMVVVKQLFQSGAGNNGQTLWDLYNAATEFADHNRSIRSTTNRFESAVFGSGYAFKERAFEIVSDLAKVNA